MNGIARILFSLAFGAMLVAACGVDTNVVGVLPDASAPVAFADIDAASSTGEAGLQSYCPTDKCPPGWTTCPNSRFPCDVNLLTDLNNCGACDRACPAPWWDAEFSCIEGACVMECPVDTFDCDGLPDNGCEASRRHDNHCGACDKKCSDPTKPCLYQMLDQLGPVDCGCPVGKVACGIFCMDLRFDDQNCGACWNFCDPGGGGAPEVSNGHYGCVESHCEVPKCNPNFGNCDDDLGSNGCETSLLTDTNCGACGYTCPDGQFCYLSTSDGQAHCGCAPGWTLCADCSSGTCVGVCSDLTSDMLHCGSCTKSCLGLPSGGACNYGTCNMHCADGRADCNDDESDGCEVDINSDPRNCGGCGQLCDAVAGQACVAGRCVVEPCREGTGGAAR